MKNKKMLARSAAAGIAGAALLAGAVPAQATQYGGHEVHGAIEAKYLALCGPWGYLGYPTTNETSTPPTAAPDRAGRYNVFSGGSIYWTPYVGTAYEVHGAIRDAWSALGWEAGRMSYPISDETSTPQVFGRYNQFLGGLIYWSPVTGAHEVYGDILQAWGATSWESGPLGFPTSGEFDVPGGRMNTFQGGDITWTRSGGAVVHITTALPPRTPSVAIPQCEGPVGD